MLRTRTPPRAAVIWLAVCVASLAQLPTRSAAQQSAGATPELIDAILRHTYRYEGGNVRVLAGRAPDDLGASLYMPPGSRILGSVVMGSSVRVFATSSTPVDSLRALYTRALEQAGWKPFAWQPRGGFVDARQSVPLMFCRDGAQLHIQHQPRDGAADLVLDYRDGMGPCGRAAERAVGSISGSASASASVSSVRVGPMLEPFEPRFPTLYAPDEAAGPARARCFSARGRSHGEMRTSTVLPTTMSAAELLAHYGRQLEAAGWRPAPNARREVAVGSWTLADTTGAQELKLQVQETGTPGARCFDVHMGVSAR